MKKRQSAGARFAAVAMITVGLLGAATAAHAQSIGTKTSPMSLYDGTTVLARGAGDTNRSGTNFVTSNMALKDMKSNGNKVFLEVWTKSNYMLDSGLGLQFYYASESRWKSTKTDSGTWVDVASVTKSIAPAGTLIVQGKTTTIITKLCEDRGIFVSDPCKQVSQSF